MNCFLFSPWGPGRPKFDNDEHQEGCALMQDFGFGLLNIDQANCQLPGKGVMCKKLALKESDCPDGWTGFKDKCYHIKGTCLPFYFPPIFHMERKIFESVAFLSQNLPCYKFISKLKEVTHKIQLTNLVLCDLYQKRFFDYLVDPQDSNFPHFNSFMQFVSNFEKTSWLRMFNSKQTQSRVSFLKVSCSFALETILKLTPKEPKCPNFFKVSF